MKSCDSQLLSFFPFPLLFSHNSLVVFASLLRVVSYVVLVGDTRANNSVASFLSAFPCVVVVPLSVFLKLGAK